MAKINVLFMTKTAEKPYPLESPIPIWPINGVPPGNTPALSCLSKESAHAIMTETAVDYSKAELSNGDINLEHPAIAPRLGSCTQCPCYKRRYSFFISIDC